MELSLKQAIQTSPLTGGDAWIKEGLPKVEIILEKDAHTVSAFFIFADGIESISVTHCNLPCAVSGSIANATAHARMPVA